MRFHISFELRGNSLQTPCIAGIYGTEVIFELSEILYYVDLNYVDYTVVKNMLNKNNYDYYSQC